MKQPTTRFLVELANALRKAEYQNVAEHMSSGMLWAVYPEWFDTSYVPATEKSRRAIAGYRKTMPWNVKGKVRG